MKIKDNDTAIEYINKIDINIKKLDNKELLRLAMEFHNNKKYNIRRRLFLNHSSDISDIKKACYRYIKSMVPKIDIYEMKEMFHWRLHKDMKRLHKSNINKAILYLYPELSRL